MKSSRWLSAVVFFTLLHWVASTCNLITSCGECVVSASWASHCQWCPKDNSCQPRDSVNSTCSSTEYLHYSSGCNMSHQRIAYDPEIAWQSRLFAATAHSSNVSYSLQNSFPGQTFDDVFQVNDSRYSGYTATWRETCTIVVAVRDIDGGTFTLLNSATDIQTDLSTKFPTGGNVELYFYDGFVALWHDKSLEKIVAASVRKNPRARLLFTGHSVGGAIASLISSQAAYTGLVSRDSLFLYTFGMPRVGNFEYATAHDRYVKHSFRITQRGDPIPHIPSCSHFECTAFFGPYHHGIEVYYANLSTSYNFMTGWQLCQEQPFNEDAACANSFQSWETCFSGSAPAFCINDNSLYFNISVEDWEVSWPNVAWSNSPMSVYKGTISRRNCNNHRTVSGSNALKIFCSTFAVCALFLLFFKQ